MGNASFSRHENTKPLALNLAASRRLRNTSGIRADHEVARMRVAVDEPFFSIRKNKTSIVTASMLATLMLVHGCY